MTQPTRAEVLKVKAEADCLYTAAEIDAALARMASAITLRLAQVAPLVLVAMTGGLVPSALLLRLLDFPLQVDYFHATRYGAATSGGQLQWIRRPPANVAGRTVLIVDDLLDHGLTLQAAVEECRRLDAAEVLTAVLVIKEIVDRPGLKTTDFHALTTPDRYLFGYGMDYKSFWRNGSGLYAVNGV